MAERVALTRAMTDSGTVLEWSLPGPVLDKHSTGGVGDKVSLILAPLIGASGGFVPMISGRGLGHTGGTLDKLDSIPGYDTAPDLARFRRVVRRAGCAIIGQTAELEPADRRLYAIRDVTATVESVPLITASILSKKLAAGAGALVMDVKTGSGAFAAAPAMARELAESIVTVAVGAGLKTTALTTDMDQVLGDSVGNALEVAEAAAYLTGARREARLHALVLALAAEMLVLGGLAEDAAAGRRQAGAALDNGGAAQAFERMVAGLGGPHEFLAAPQKHLLAAPVVRACPPNTAGVITGMDTRRVGLAVIALAGGRRRAADRIDHAVGLTQVRGPGDPVAPDTPLALIHAADEAAAEAAIAELQDAITVGETAPEPKPVVIERIGAAIPGRT